MLSIEDKLKLVNVIDNFKKDLEITHVMYNQALTLPRKKKKQSKILIRKIVDSFFTKVSNDINNILFDNKLIIKDPYEFLTNVFKDVKLHKNSSENLEQEKSESMV